MNTRIICRKQSTCVYNKETLRAIKVQITRKSHWDFRSPALLNKNWRSLKDLKISVRNDNAITFTRPLMKHISVILEKQNVQHFTHLLKDGKQWREIRNGSEENQNYKKTFRGNDVQGPGKFIPQKIKQNRDISERSSKFKRIFISKSPYVSSSLPKQIIKRSPRRGSNITSERRKEKAKHFNGSCSSLEGIKFLHRTDNDTLTLHKHEKYKTSPFTNEKYSFLCYKDERCLKCSHYKREHEKYFASENSTIIFKT